MQWVAKASRLLDLTRLSTLNRSGKVSDGFTPRISGLGGSLRFGRSERLLAAVTANRWVCVRP
jgi:hypothetical protein